ncbi:MAG: bifunctional nicotinamidase/pyrazinamidase [Nitrospinota bacterium]|nr:bifunctional nicotinamidase/pyrazinamidase [Nitrospinota bacterium]
MSETERGAALIIVDVQYDFLPGGALAVPSGAEVVPVINRLAHKFDHIIMTQDWHPPGHASFASSHPGKAPYDTVELTYGRQILWPDHCVQQTRGAMICEGLDVPGCRMVIRKGHHKGIDSYSTFMENDHKTPTGLAGYLGELGVGVIFLTGLATDFCVQYSALDGVAAGFEVHVVEDACRGIDIEGSLAAAWNNMESVGAKRIRSQDI